MNQKINETLNKNFFYIKKINKSLNKSFTRKKDIKNSSKIIKFVEKDSNDNSNSDDEGEEVVIQFNKKKAECK